MKSERLLAMTPEELELLQAYHDNEDRLAQYVVVPRGTLGIRPVVVTYDAASQTSLHDSKGGPVQSLHHRESSALAG